MLSVIIPITGENRKKHAEVCIHFLQDQLNFDNYEIILVEQIDALLGDKKLGGPFYKNLSGIDKYLAIKGPNQNHFNQPWMANVGARIARGDKFLFYDIDMVCPKTYLKAVYNFSEPYFIAWNPMIAMNEEKSKRVIATKKLTADVLEGSEQYNPGILEYAGFSTCISKKFFYNKLGGYNENYPGWGGNDNDIAWRAFKIYGRGKNILPHRLFHLWHSKGYSKYLLWERRSIWRTTYKYPVQINNRLLALSGQLGNPNKPTFINIDDIRVDAKKEHQLKKSRKK